eukprot:478098-Amphidinium_carterae.1
MSWQRSTAERLGITWPPPKRRPGKPRRRQLWRELLYRQMKQCHGRASRRLGARDGLAGLGAP